MRTITSLGVAILTLLLVTVSQLGTARAQYPTPSGSLAVTASQASATIGGTVAIEATLRDLSGATVANQACTLAVASQPGSDASVTPASAATDANGVVHATLYVGSTPGLVVVRATCGNLVGSVSVLASAPVQPTPTAVSGGPGAVGQPPQSGVELPNTGNGGSAGSNGTEVRIGVAAAIVLLILGGQALRMYRRRRPS